MLQLVLWVWLSSLCCLASPGCSEALPLDWGLACVGWEVRADRSGKAVLWAVLGRQQ